ncbi:uncharacterized protein LOC125078597 [Lutra lutra]|uniref:uncharacterized protein LOC125078597 n=1 Tax=Lutra lutra TaxID=9657 RepID=UPI001FD40AB1|nr:uncharacterized protein LOC125078597 [Lutra lutra]
MWTAPGRKGVAVRGRTRPGRRRGEPGRGGVAVHGSWPLWVARAPRPLSRGHSLSSAARSEPVEQAAGHPLRGRLEPQLWLSRRPPSSPSRCSRAFRSFQVSALGRGELSGLTFPLPLTLEQPRLASRSLSEADVCFGACHSQKSSGRPCQGVLFLFSASDGVGLHCLLICTCCAAVPLWSTWAIPVTHGRGVTAPEQYVCTEAKKRRQFSDNLQRVVAQSICNPVFHPHSAIDYGGKGFLCPSRNGWRPLTDLSTVRRNRVPLVLVA